jgi:hypothetical protein
VEERQTDKKRKKKKGKKGKKKGHAMKMLSVANEEGSEQNAIAELPIRSAVYVPVICKLDCESRVATRARSRDTSAMSENWLLLECPARKRLIGNDQSA